MMSKLFDELLVETTNLNISALTSEKKKNIYIDSIKKKLDDEFDAICKENEIDLLSKKDKDQCWILAIEHADNELGTGVRKLKINGFYVQELFHKYVELCIDRVF